MNKQWLSLGLFAVLAMAGVGCDEDVRSTPDMGRILDIGFGTDTGASDAGDAGLPREDAGAGCTTGRSCDEARGCNGRLACQGEIAFTQGGAMGEPVYLPDGGTTMFGGLYFQDGYCTNAAISDTSSREGTAGACDPTPDVETPGMDNCPACAKCISIGPDQMGNNIVQCYARCAPSATGNPCRDGYTCDFGNQVCTFGCQTDQECQLYRADTNGDGMVTNDTPDGGVPDRLMLDTNGGATCSATTGRCTQPGTTGVEAGATCVLDSECEADGRCLSELSFDGWTDGYCTKFGCDVLGCEGDGKCLDVGGGTNICTAGCKIGEPGDEATGAGAGDDDCRPGYACVWDNTSTPAAVVNGGCLPGNYNAVATENIGAACNDPDGPTGDLGSDEQCWSPYGLGRCIFADAIATCSILGCAQLPTGACGVGNVCAPVGGTTTACLRSCTTPADCSADMGRAGQGCVDLTGMGGTARVCFPGCQVDADCNAAYRCDGGSAMAFGDCILR